MVLHHLVRIDSPLRAVVLDIDLAACVSVRAVKGSPTAIGRRTTGALLRALPAADSAVAAVNADFFAFAPAGVPVSLHVEGGRIVSGASERPVLAFDSRGVPFIGRPTVRAVIRGVRDSVVATTWNRPRRGAVGVIDAAWGQPLDSLSRPGARQLVPVVTDAGGAPRFVIRTPPSSFEGQAAGDTLLLTGTAALSDGDTVSVRREWTPMAPQHAVGGFPLLLADSAITTSIDTDGAESFRGVNPRTAVGLSRNRKRLFLLVIDGRRAGFSVGTTTRATAEWLQAIGAVEALNLDGGGSSAMVVRSLDTGDAEPANRPSDPGGERAVANALVVTRTCAKVPE